jgi:oxygen-dependent protoporphyrinogen oxidase
MTRLAVIGGGIAGLAAAMHLHAEHDVVVFERDAAPGGKIRSQRIDGFLFEWGPSTFLSSAAELRALVADAGLDAALTEAAPAAKNRYIYWNGALHKLPAKPPQALGMDILSLSGKLRAFSELLARAPAAPRDDESVDAFMRRHFGAEVATRIVAPALLGISGGDAALTSLDAIFPRVRDMERNNGSIIRALMRAPRQAPAAMCSFAEGGMQMLTDGIAAKLGARVRTSTAIERLERRNGGWRLHHNGGPTDVEAVIITTPAPAAAGLLEGVDPNLAATLRRIPYAPMRAVGVAFRRSDVADPLDGFGFLAARGQGVRLLGAFYTSTIVPAHAPPDAAYVRIFLGGATDPEITRDDPERVRAIVLADLTSTLGITASPIAYHEAIWPEAIPQYTLAHRAIVREIESQTAALPGLGLAGNAYRGLGVGDTVRDAQRVAAALSGATTRTRE